MVERIRQTWLMVGCSRSVLFSMIRDSECDFYLV